jgi:Zn-dependent M28 family amino/carboxypeptidase
VTGEEKGLLGSAFYATHPLYPLNKTAAEINMDELNVWGPMSDVTVIGLGNSTLDDALSRVLSAEKRTMRPDPEPEKGFYYRSDHFSFAKQGVPALYTEPGVDLVGQPAGSGKILRDKYDETDYHKPSDEVKPDWDLRGAIGDLRTLFQVGWLVANSTDWPQWSPGTEFKAKRDSMMARR